MRLLPVVFGVVSLYTPLVPLAVLGVALGAASRPAPFTVALGAVPAAPGVAPRASGLAPCTAPLHALLNTAPEHPLARGDALAALPPAVCSCATRVIFAAIWVVRGVALSAAGSFLCGLHPQQVTPVSTTRSGAR